MNITYSYYHNMNDESWSYRFHGTFKELFRDISHGISGIDTQIVHDRLNRYGTYSIIDDISGSYQTIYVVD